MQMVFDMWYLTCVKSNEPISNLRSESERKYSKRTRTIAGSPSLSLSRTPFESKSQNNPYGEPVCRLCPLLILLSNYSDQSFNFFPGGPYDIMLEQDCTVLGTGSATPSHLDNRLPTLLSYCYSAGHFLY